MAARDIVRALRGATADVAAKVLLPGQLLWDKTENFLMLGDDALTSGGIIVGDGGFTPGHQSAYWILPGNVDIAPSSGTATLGFVSWVPIPLWGRGRVSIDRIGVNVSGAGGGGDTVRIALYENDNGKPGALLEESAALSTSTTGMKTHTISRSHYPQWVWGAFQASAGSTATYTNQSATGASSVIGFPNGTAVQRPNMWFRAYAYGAFPDPATPTGVTSLSVPMVMVRKT